MYGFFQKNYGSYANDVGQGKVENFYKAYKKAGFTYELNLLFNGLNDRGDIIGNLSINKGILDAFNNPCKISQTDFSAFSNLINKVYSNGNSEWDKTQKFQGLPYLNQLIE